MGKAALFVMTLCVLAASGWAFVHNGYALHKGGAIPLAAGRAAVDLELTAAASQMLQGKAGIGSYAYLDLKHFHNLVVARANDTSYCLQVGSGASARHLAGPGGLPAAGPCT